MILVIMIVKMVLVMKMIFATVFRAAAVFSFYCRSLQPLRLFLDFFLQAFANITSCPTQLKFIVGFTLVELAVATHVVNKENKEQKTEKQIIKETKYRETKTG